MKKKEKEKEKEQETEGKKEKEKGKDPRRSSKSIIKDVIHYLHCLYSSFSHVLQLNHSSHI